MDVMEIPAGDGRVLIEIPPPTTPYGSEHTSVADRVAERVDAAVVRTRSVVTRIAQEVAQGVRDLPESDRPTGYTVEFGVGFTAEGSATVAKAGAAGTLKVTLLFGSASGPPAG
ncbi:CU044_2847 family protein [Streptomyces sp. NPDC046887]|uniref:CU044_2847 family protein n=1 Tax=Streptomyces sp. NPDC046887 TaxID=3155472 RepID=UPI0033CAFC11